MVEVIFHGHSCVEIVGKQTRLLIDPFLRNNPQADVTPEELLKKRIDYLIVTHGHQDHIGDAVEIAKEAGCLVICTFEVEHRFHTQGVSKTSSQHIGGTVSYDNVTIKFTPALHGGSIMNTGSSGEAAGVLIFLDEKCVYHAGDTGLSKEMELLGTYEAVDIALLPIGDRYTMGVTDAVRAVHMIQPRYVVPIHFDTRPGIAVDPIEFARQVMLESKTVPKVLRPGQSLIIE